MKIFAVYFNFELTKKPKWFDGFRDKYKTTSIFHITLIQPRYVDEDQIHNLKTSIEEVLNKHTFTDPDKKLIFGEALIEREEEGQYIFMWQIKENRLISQIQKELMEEKKISAVLSEI